MRRILSESNHKYNARKNPVACNTKLDLSNEGLNASVEKSVEGVDNVVTGEKHMSGFYVLIVYSEKGKQEQKLMKFK